MEKINSNNFVNYLKEYNLKLTNQRSDTLDLAYVLKPCEPEYNLAKIAESLSISHSRPHRALNDSKITATLFQKLVKDSEELDPGIISKISEIASKSNWVLSYIFERLAAYRSFPPKNKKDERWIVYAKNIEASKINTDWYLWMHHTVNEVPKLKENKYLWQKEHSENLTGTSKSYKPAKISKSNKAKKYDTWKN